MCIVSFPNDHGGVAQYTNSTHCTQTLLCYEYQDAEELWCVEAVHLAASLGHRFIQRDIF